jgi:electron transport complex protein RnfD
MVKTLTFAKSTDDARSMLPEPGSLRVGPPPHWKGLTGLLPMEVSFAVAAVAIVLSGLVLFGWHSIRVVAISAGVALLVESAFNTIKGRSPSWSESHALLIGLLFGCTLPATASWRVVLTGAFIAVIVGEALSGGIGNYLWHPVALGRVTVQILFYNELTASKLPVLAPGHLLWGSLEEARELPALASWGSLAPPPGIEAWLVAPPGELLRQALVGPDRQPAPAALAAFVRDHAPTWSDTITGVAGGGIGEACAFITLVAGGLLLWRGFLRWPMAAAAVAAAALGAAILPVHTQASDGTGAMMCSLPGLAVWEGLPVGAAYVMYHLTAGGFLFVVLVLASDPSSSPLTSRGQALFGQSSAC